MLESIVPEPAPDGVSDHVTFVFDDPLTEAVYCQFAPVPMGQGGEAEAMQGELVMLTVTCGGGVVFEDEPPPHPDNPTRHDKDTVRNQLWNLKFCKAHLSARK